MALFVDASVVEEILRDVQSDLTDQDVLMSEREDLTDEQITAYTDALRYASAVIDRRLIEYRHRQARMTVL